MKVLVIGAGGGVGGEAVKQAVARGHEVTALVHHAADDLAAGVRIVEGDARDPAKVREAVVGQDAVLDAVGGSTPWRRTGLEADAARAIVAVMQTEGVRRLVVVSALGVGDSKNNAPFFYEHVLMPTFLRGTVKDKAEMEEELRTADLDWIVVRPAALTDDEGTGEVKVYASDDEETPHKIARADVATFMLDQLGSDTHLRQMVSIATE